jgi:hypothetical protein
MSPSRSVFASFWLAFGLCCDDGKSGAQHHGGIHGTAAASLAAGGSIGTFNGLPTPMARWLR